MTTERSRPAGRGRLHVEWLVLSALLIAGALWLGPHANRWRPSQVLYDQWISWDGRPANPAIVIVAIDAPSLAQLGRWPWPRSVHAALLDRLAQSRARAIGLDLILSEADGRDPANDRALASAIQRNGRVVLPMYAEAGRPMLPVPAFAGAAAAIGHIHLELDEDGVARSVFLREGTQGAWWDHFAVALLRTADLSSAITPLPGERLPAALRQAPPPRAWPHTWLRDDWIHIPFTGPPGHYPQVSYASVLRGDVPPSFFDDKLVLVGTTATGLGDSHPTPTSGHAHAMPGIEITANVIDALLAHRIITYASPAAGVALPAVVILLAMLGHFVLTPRRSLALTLVLATAVMAGSYWLLTRHGLWLAPTLTVLGLAAAYPLWSWRRLEAVIRHLGHEFTLLDREPHLLPEPANATSTLSDAVERHVRLVRQAATRVRALRRFVHDSVDALPDATLVAGPDARILLANRAALRYFGVLHEDALHGTPLQDLLAPLPCAPGLWQNYWRQPSADAAVDTQDNPPDGKASAGVKTRDAAGRDLLVKFAALAGESGEDGAHAGWIVTLIDISQISAAQRQREDTLRFLSHDLRSPQTAILALLDNQQRGAAALPQDTFLDRIGKYARRTLHLADDFVQLARAESQPYRRDECDLAQLVLDAVDSVWEQARAKRMAVTAELACDTAPCLADGALLVRAVVNLLDNAIKYSAAGTRTTCRLSVDKGEWLLEVRDQGRGIAEEHLPRLFDKFERFATDAEDDPGGTGLGLAFVKTVIEKHHGRIDVQSAVGCGTVFRIRLPAAPA